jgi:hypothetical protein
MVCAGRNLPFFIILWADTTKVNAVHTYHSSSHFKTSAADRGLLNIVQHSTSTGRCYLIQHHLTQWRANTNTLLTYSHALVSNGQALTASDCLTLMLLLVFPYPSLTALERHSVTSLTHIPTYSRSIKCKPSGSLVSARCRMCPSSGVHSRSQRPRGLKRGPSAQRLVGSWVRIPPRAGMFVSCTVFLLSGRGLCEGLITRPEESYRVWCV